MVVGSGSSGRVNELLTGWAIQVKFNPHMREIETQDRQIWVMERVQGQNVQYSRPNRDETMLGMTAGVARKETMRSRCPVIFIIALFFMATPVLDTRSIAQENAGAVANLNKSSSEVSDEQYLFKVKGSKNVKIPSPGYGLKYIDIFKHLYEDYPYERPTILSTAIVFANDSERYAKLGKDDFDFQSEFITFRIDSGLYPMDSGNIEYDIKFNMPHGNKAYFFGHIDGSLMACSGLQNNDSGKVIVVSSIIKVNNHYIQAILMASHDGYDMNDVTRFERLMREWTIKFIEIN